MKLVIQRVKHASVTIDGEVVGKIGQGFMVLAGIAQTDTEEIADKMINKMCKLRIFEDEKNKFIPVGRRRRSNAYFPVHTVCQYKKRKQAFFY